MASSIGPTPWCSHRAPSDDRRAQRRRIRWDPRGRATAARRRATRSASTTVTPGGVDDVRTSSDRRVGPPAGPTDRADLEHAAAHRRHGIARRHVHDEGRWTLAAPRNRRSAPVRWASRSGRSVTTTTCRPSAPSSWRRVAACAVGVVGGDDGRGRPAGPCGSQRHQSHDDGSSTTTTSRQSAGPVHVASWMISERTTDAAAGPAMASAAPAPSSAGTGASSNCSAAATTAVSSAPADVPGRRATRRGRPPTSTGPHPSVTRNASAWSARRPHTSALVVVAATIASATGGVVARWCCHRARTLRGDRRRERGQLAPVDGARPPPVPGCAHATGDPHPGGGEQPNRTEEQEQRRSHDDARRRPIRPSCRRPQSHRSLPAAGSAMRTPARESASGAHRGNGRGVRCTVGRHGSAGSAVNAAAPLGRTRRPTDAQPAGPDADRRTVLHHDRGADRLAVDLGRDAPGQLGEPHASVGGDVEEAVVGFECGVGEGHRAARRATDDVASGVEGDDRAGRRPRLGDDQHRRRLRLGPARAGRLRPPARGDRRLPRRTPARPSVSCRPTGRPSSSSAAVCCRPRASASSPMRSSSELGTIETRRPDGATRSSVGSGPVPMPLVGVGRRRKRKGPQSFRPDQGR